MPENKRDQFPRVTSASAPQVDIDALLGGLHGEFQSDMRAMSAAGAARVEEKAVEVAASVDARVENDGRPRRRPIDDYTQIKREAVEQWFDTTDRRSQLERMRICLFDLGRICGDISNLRGWRSLTAAVESLPEHELIDKVSWSRKLDWLDTQFAALENPDKSTDLETPEKLKELHLQLHDLLVASQKTLSELRKGPEVASDAPRGRGEREAIDERNFSEKLTEATSLLDEWSELRLQLPTEKERKEFDAAVREKSGETRLPGLNSHKAQLAYLTRKAGGEGVADDVGAVKHYDLGVWLPKYRRFVQVAREVATEFREKSQSDRRTRKGGSERTPEDLGTKEGKIRALEQRLERWSRLVREFEIMGQANRLAEVMATFLVAKKIPKWDWREQHEAVKRELGDIRSGESKRKEEKQATFIESNIAWYDECIQVVEPVLRSLKGESESSRTSTPSKPATQPLSQSAVSTTATPTKVAEPVRSPVPASVPDQSPAVPKASPISQVLPQTKPNIASEGKTLETSASIEESLGKLRRQDREIWYRNQVGDILVVRPTKNVELFQLWRPDGSMRLEHYRSLATALYSEGVSFEGNRLQRGGAPYGEKMQGDSVNESKQNPGTLNQKLSPEGERQVGELVALLEQQRDRWRARIEAISDKKDFDALTSEAGMQNGRYTITSGPGFVVGDGLIRLLKERSITDPAVIEAIKKHAWALQQELRPLYLAKRNELYPPRTADVRAAGSTTEAPKQETLQQLSREQIQNFLKQVLGSARNDLLTLYTELGTEGGLKDITKRKAELTKIFLEAMLPAIVGQIKKKVALDETLSKKLETLLKTLPDEVV